MNSSIEPKPFLRAGDQVEIEMRNEAGASIFGAIRQSVATVAPATLEARAMSANPALPHVFDAPPPGAAADWTIPQNWAAFTPEEHARWDTLFARQSAQLPGRAVAAFLNGLDVLKLSRPGIPDFDELNAHLGPRTGWKVVAVPGLVPDEVFFDHLANRRFVAGRFIRGPHQMDYLREPDVFHDVFGHVPLLADPVFADYMQAYGRGGLRAVRLGGLEMLARLYWYTVEFGLIHEGGRLKIFGAGMFVSPHKLAVDREGRAILVENAGGAGHAKCRAAQPAARILGAVATPARECHHYRG